MRVYLSIVFVAAAVISSTKTLKAQTGLGAGLSSLPCSEIIAKSDDEALNDWINFWMKGFWTGLNLASDTHGGTTKDLSDSRNDHKALEARVLAYCYENPETRLLDIAVQFYSDLPAHPARE